MDLENEIDLKNLDNFTKNSFGKFEETCRALQTARLVTEKKNLLSEITEFLNDSKIVRILDLLANQNVKNNSPDKENIPQYSQSSNSQRNYKSFSLNWNILFNLIQNFVINELNLLKDKNPSLTQTQRSGTTPNVDNKIYQLRACLNLLLNQINSRGQNNLELENFFNLFDRVIQLNEEYTAFQIKILNDLSNFLSNYILNNSKYCSELKKENWVDLINFYMSNYLNSLASSIAIDPVCTLRCLRRILNNINDHIGLINTTKIFAFISTGILSLKKDSNPELIENLVACALELCNSFQNDCLFEILKLGEETGFKMIEIFESKNATPVSKDLVVKFLSIQIEIHKNVPNFGFEQNQNWMKLIKLFYNSMADEHMTSLQIKLSSLNLKSTKSSINSFQSNEREENITNIIVECLYSLINIGNIIVDKPQLVKSDTDDESENTLPCSARKKRKVDNETFSWSYLISKIDHDIDLLTKLFWAKLLEKLFKSYLKNIPKSVLSDIISCFVIKNLGQIESKPTQLNDNQLRINVFNQSFLKTLSELFKHIDLEEKNELFKNKIDFTKLFNYCMASQTNQDLIIEILGLEPRLTINLVNRFVSNEENLDMFSLELIAKSSLNSLEPKIKTKIIDFILNNDTGYQFEFGYESHKIVLSIILQLSDLTVLNLPVDYLDVEFLFAKNSTQEKRIDASESKIEVDTIPNINIIEHVVEILLLRLKNFIVDKSSEAKLSEFFLATKILTALNTLQVKNLEDLKTSLEDFVVDLINRFDMTDNLDQSISFVTAMYLNLKHLESKDLFFEFTGSKIIEKCLRILEINHQDEKFTNQLVYLNDIGKTEYLKLIAFGLLCNLSIEYSKVEAYKKISSNLKAKIFKFINVNKSVISEHFFIVFLICFMYDNCGLLELSEYETCLKWFHALMNLFDNFLIKNRVLIVKIFRKYFSKILIQSSCRSTDEDLTRCRDLYLKIVDKHFLSECSSAQLNLEICGIFADILKLMRIERVTKKDIIGYFNKFYNQFFNSPNQFLIVKKRALSLLSEVCFIDSKTLNTRYIYEFYKNGDLKDLMKNLEKFYEDNESPLDDLENAFFDRIYANLVLSNKVFEHEFENIFDLSSNVQRNMENNDKYNIFKKFYVTIKKQLSEPVVAKNMVLDFFDQLTGKSKNLGHKFLGKSLFGLVQITSEFGTHFKDSEVKNLVNKVPKLNRFKSNIIGQWMEIYVAEKEDLDEINKLLSNKFPFRLFGYQDLREFYLDHAHHIVTYSIEKFQTLPENIFENLTEEDFENLKPNIYASLLAESFFKLKENLALNVLFKQKILEIDFLEKNFGQIFELLFLNNKMDDPDETKMFSYINVLLELFGSDQNRSKTFYKLLGDHAFYLYRILLKLNNLVLNAETNNEIDYYFDLFQIIVDGVVLPINENSFNLISNVNGTPVFLNDFIIFTLVNSLKICIKKYQELIVQKTSDNKFLNIVYETSLFVKDFIVKIFNQFFSLVKHLEGFFELYDYSISCLIWHLLDFLNVYSKLELEIDFMNELNSNLFKNITNFLIKYSKFSTRLKRQFKFLFNQTRFIDNTFHDCFYKDNLLLNLKKIGLVNEKFESYLNYDFNNEVKETLMSLDFDKNLTFKYILCYITSLVLIEFKKENYEFDKDLINLMVKKVLYKCGQMDANKIEVYQLVAILMCKLGPVSNKRHFERVLNMNEKRDRFIHEKFQFESNNLFHSFYLSLSQNLFEFLSGDDPRMQMLAHELLERIFSTQEFDLFIQEYEKYSHEFVEKIENENEQLSDLSNKENYQNIPIDYFGECAKVFKRKEKRTFDLANLDHTESRFNTLKNEDLWSFKHKTYEIWLKQMVNCLLNIDSVRDNVCEISREFFEENINICEKFVPIFFLILANSHSNFARFIGEKISKSLNECKIHFSEQKDLSTIKKIIKLYLDIIDFIRTDSIKRKKNAIFWNENAEFWNCIDFLELAQVANMTGLHYKAVYFIEIWYNLKMKDKKIGFKNQSSEILKSEPNSIEILFSSNKSIGETNALDSELIYFIEKSQQFNFMDFENTEDSLNHFDNYLNNADEVDQKNVSIVKFGLINTLKNKGLTYISKHLSNNFIHEYKNFDELNDLRCYTSVKMSTWDLSDSKEKSNIRLFDECFKESNNLMFMIDEKSQQNELIITKINKNIRKSTDFLVKELISKNYTTNEIDHVTTRFYQLEELKKHLAFSNNRDTNCLTEILNNLQRYSNFELKYFENNSNNFNLFNDILSNRLEYGQKFLMNVSSDKIQHIKNYVAALFESIVENSINFKRFEIGQIFINQMRNLLLIPSLKCDIIESQLLYSKSNLKKAKFLLKNSIENFESTILNTSQTVSLSEISSYIKALDLYGNLLNETKSENPTVIIRELLEKSVFFISKFNLDAQSDKLQLIVDTFFSLAKFADTQYQNICDYVKSKSFEEHAELMKKFQQESNKTKIIDPTSHFNMILHKQYDIDREEMKTLLENKEVYLCKAIKYYLYCLALGSVKQKDDYSVFRLVSLWTQNSSNLNVNKTVEEKIFKISTHKFLVLIHQLSARMSLKNLNLNVDGSNSSDDVIEKLFQTILINLVTQISQDHPHHTLPVLLAFSNSHKDFLITKTKDEEVTNYLKTEDRVNTSNHILEKLKNNSECLRQIIESLGQVCDAYIELANTHITTRPKPNEPLIFPKSLLINKIRNYNFTNVLTNRINLNPNGVYPDSELVYIIKFDPKYKIANGVNMPKIIHCLGSDGVLRKQLVKGRDDLRQDAVMQQFFGTVNDLIMFNNNSRNTVKLSTMRTYKIVPLSQKSGVLEWCENTITFGDWLIGQNQDGGAHKKYEPNDLRFDECKRILYEASQPNGLKKMKKKSKLEVFLEVTEKFKPVFRYFFMENFLTQNEWYEKRVNYTKNVATSSIVGYIVGLGDRHVQNILIDTNSADVIHIDLGIAFEQGKILPIPETIPFRLTRDVIDGFGVCGTEGIFKNCCEATLQLLKMSREQIMTIFEVLLYDPLHNWCLSPAKAFMMQQATVVSSEDMETSVNLSSTYSSTYLGKPSASQHSSRIAEKNKIAERILLQIQQKLLGYENGTQLSINGQVNYLINEASNPENLCRIYVGWQPYL